MGNYSKCGFIKDENNLQLIKVFQNESRFKEIYIDIYSDNPFDKVVAPMLLMRTFEKRVEVRNNNRNLILIKDDEYNTYIMNVMFDNITDNYFKMNSKNSFDFCFKCQNIFYKITICN